MANKKAVPKPKSSLIEETPSTPFHFKGRSFHFVFIGTVIALCFALYGNSIPNGYSLDDEFVLHGDTTVQKGIEGIPALFKSRYAWDQKGTYGYRPVVKTTFAVEYKFFGVSPHAGHAINICIYALLIISFFYFFRKILYAHASDYFLLLVTGIFLAHPLHTEVVDSLKNRDTMLSFLFGLLGVYALVKCFEPGSKRIMQVVLIIAACIFFNLGYLAKPDAVLYNVIAILVLYFFIAKPLKPIGIFYVCISIAVFAERKIVHTILPSSNYHRTFLFFENPLLGTHWYQHFQLGFASLWFYMHKLIFPKDLVSYYGYNEFNPFPKWTDADVLAGLVVAGIIVWVLYKMAIVFFKNDKKMNIWLFSFLLFVVPLAAFVNVFKVGPGLVAERFMFIPSIGFALMASLLLYKLFKVPLKGELSWSKYKNIFIASFVIFVVYSFRVIERNPDWKTHLSVYEHDAKEAPHSAKLQSLLAAAYVDEIKNNKNLSPDEKGDLYRKAEKAFLASIDIYPNYATSLNNVGMIEYIYYKNPGAALDYFNKAIACDSNYTEALFNAASSYRELKNYPMAEEYFLKTLDVNPAYDMGYTYLTKLYTSEGKYAEALKLNENAIKKGHGSDGVYINIGKIYMENGDTGKAITYFDTALTYFSKNQILCQWLANYYMHKKDSVRAEHYLNMLKAADNFTNEAIKRQ